jgi:hypothetical protein
MRREGNPYWDLQSPKIDEKRGKSLLEPPIGQIDPSGMRLKLRFLEYF